MSPNMKRKGSLHGCSWFLEADEQVDTTRLTHALARALRARRQRKKGDATL